MDLHQLLQRQINKYLTNEDLNSSSVNQFITAINDSYRSFERDKELLNHAFVISEGEFNKVNSNLNKEYEQKKLSIEKLKSAIKNIDAEKEIKFDEDLLSIADYLSTQITKRKEVEASLTRTLKLLTTLLSNLKSGIIVEDEDRRVLFANQNFCDIFSLSSNSDSLEGQDICKLTEQEKVYFKEPDNFVDRLNDLVVHKKSVSNEELYLSDGRILQRDYVPIFIQNVYKGSLWSYTDVTDQKTFENRLVKLTNIQEGILNGTDYSIIYTDVNGVIKTFNKGAENMLGYTSIELVDQFSPAIFHDTTEVIRRADFLSNQHQQKVNVGFEVFVHNARKGIVETLEWTYIKKDGTRFPVLLSVSRIVDRMGSIIGFLGIARNIEEQKKAEEALRLSEEKYRNIIERSTDVIYKTDSKGFFTYVNPVAERITGYTQEEFLQKRFTDLIKDTHRVKAQQFYRDQVVNRKATSYLEFPIITKDGAEKWIGQSVQLAEIGKANYEFTALAIDITERRNYERKILLQEEKYRNIITNMHLGLMEVDLDDTIQFMNQGFCSISGYQKEELIGRKASEVLSISNGIELVLEKTSKRREGISDMYEVQVKNKQGEKRWWMVSGGPNYNDEGVLVGSIGIHLDITENKKLERELEIEKKRAEDSSKAKETFLANMSHEIRTPLNGIIGMIRELTHEKLTEKQGKFVSNASIASQHLLSVLNNILDISKIEAGELNLEEHHFRLKDTIKDVKAIMTTKAREKGLFMGLDVYDIKNETYIGDSARLRQILLNLLGNAIKFTSKGGVFLECKIRKKDTSFHTVSISVEDTGIGMDESYQKSLFKKFSQEDLTTSRKYGGTGLGMAITYELIQLMKGTISVKSKKNEGTIIEVVFDLPIGQNDKINKNDDTVIMKDISHARILLVEDNEFNRAVACNTFRRSNCSVVEAENGMEAINRLKEGNRFDIILMDLQMPVMDGFKATAFIRETLKDETPIIALTANAFKSEIDVCYSLGMNDYVTKPFEEKTLIDVIAKQLSRSTSLKVLKENKAELPAKEKLYNLNSLIEMSGNNPSFVTKMVKLFIEQSQLALSELARSYAASDMANVYQIIHKMKPMVDSMGITTLKKEVREIELLAKEGINTTHVAELIALLKETLLAVMDQMKQNELALLDSAE